MGQRGGARAQAGNDKEFKGGKRLRGRKGRTAKRKRPKGDGSSSRAEGSTGTGVAGEGDGANSGGGKENKKNNGYGLPGSSHDNEWSADEEGQGSESDCLGGGRRDRVGRADLAGGDGVGLAAPRGEAADETWREAYTEGCSRADVKGQETAEVCVAEQD